MPRTIAEHFEAVKKIILDNHRITIREICWQEIFKDVLGMKRAVA